MGQIENTKLILRRLAFGELRQPADNPSIECCPLGTTLAKDKVMLMKSTSLGQFCQLSEPRQSRVENEISQAVEIELLASGDTW